VSVPPIRFVEPEEYRAMQAAWDEYCAACLNRAAIRFGLPVHLVGSVPPEPEADTPIVVEAKRE
jgi:hypothetical protein